MRLLISCALLLTALAPAFGQTANPSPALPTDPRALINAAKAFYNFPSAGMRPWHVKADYQLYDPQGAHIGNGTFEYWWASPQVHRSRWTRPGVDRSEWSTADGKTYVQASGPSLPYLESRIDEMLFSPIPWSELQDPAKTSLDLKMVPPKKPELACLVATPQPPSGGAPWKDVRPLQSSYCFDLQVTGLRSALRHDLLTEYSGLIKSQGHYLARQVKILAGANRTLLSVSINTYDALNSTTSTLSPPADATLETIPANPLEVEAIGSLVKKTMPEYPPVAKENREQGAVVLSMLIGKDGKPHDLEVVSSVWPALADSAVKAVSKWEYKPYLLKNGQPIEVRTLVDVIFSIP